MGKSIAIFAALATLAWAASPAAAADGNPGFMQPGSIDVPDPNDEMNVSDILFAREAARGGRTEVDFGELVKNKAKSGPARDFANLMVEDHTKANQELMGIIDKHKVVLPKELDPEHKAARSRLEKLEGRDLELAYLALQVADHQKTALLLTWEIGSGQNAALKAFAEKTLPVVLGHLEKAKTTLLELRTQAR
jgi:putative membrane protein